MIDNRIAIQRGLREGTIKPCNVLRLDADKLVAIEEEDWLVLEKLIRGDAPPTYPRAVFAASKVVAEFEEQRAKIRAAYPDLPATAC